MKKQTVYNEAHDRQKRAVHYAKLVSAKWLAQETDIDLARIYRIRAGRAGALSHVEVETICNVVATLFNNR